MNPQDKLVEAVVSRIPRSEKLVNMKVDLKDWKLKKVYKDTLWVKMIDDPDASTVMRNGIVLANEQAKGPYALGEIIMAGPDATVKEGERIMFIRQTGQPAHRSYEGYKSIFIREESVIAVVEYDGSDEEMKRDIEDQILLGR